MNKEELRDKVEALSVTILKNEKYDVEEILVNQSKVLESIDQLDEPSLTETSALLENVLKENKRLGRLLQDKQEEIYTLLDSQSSEPEKPVIPQFVADWMEKYIDYGYDLYPALNSMENNSRSWIRIYEWYRKNTFEFVIAYLTKKYEVEEDSHPILQAFDEKVKEYEDYGSTSMRMAEVRKVLVEALEEEEE